MNQYRRLWDVPCPLRKTTLPPLSQLFPLLESPSQRLGRRFLSFIDTALLAEIVHMKILLLCQKRGCLFLQAKARDKEAHQLKDIVVYQKMVQAVSFKHNFEGTRQQLTITKRLEKNPSRRPKAVISSCLLRIKQKAEGCDCRVLPNCHDNLKTEKDGLALFVLLKVLCG